METNIQPSANTSILLYNTQNIGEEQLKAQFTLRTKEYEKIWQDIKTHTMEHPATHYLIQGIRGAGKTTLLTRLYYAVNDDAKLNQWLIPILFNEEEYGVFSLFTFWLKVAEKLNQTDNQWYKHLYNTLQNLEADQEGQAWPLIRKSLQQHQHKLLLLVDNLAELFASFNPSENAQLREILSLHSEVRLVGGSSIILDAHFDGTAPFYQFFKLVSLKAISESEMHQLFITLAKQFGDLAVNKIQTIIQEHPERLEAIRRLADGVPRTLVLLFQIIMEGGKDSSFAYLEETIDKTTPLYKHRMDDLSKQQQVIVHHIAMNWDAMSAKEIAQQTRLPSKTVSAQLVELQKRWVIEKVPTNTRNHLYRVQERFFNIWYLMRYGDKQDKRRVLWLTKFLENWYTEKELSIKLVETVVQLVDKDNKTQDLLVNALLASDKIDADIRKAIKAEYDNRLNRQSITLDNSQPQIQAEFSELVKTADDKAVSKFIEQHENKMSLTDYLIFSHQLHTMQSKLFDPAKILSHVLTQSNTGLFEFMHLFTAIYRKNLVGYKAVSIQVLGESLQQLPENTIFTNIMPMISIFWTLCIWGNQFEVVAEILKNDLVQDLFDSELLEISDYEMDALKEVFFDDFIEMLLVKEQYEMAYRLFDQFNLKELLKPYYYATLSFFNDERNQEYLRMGPELNQTVNEILKSVEKYRKIYASRLGEKNVSDT